MCGASLVLARACFVLVAVGAGGADPPALTAILQADKTSYATTERISFTAIVRNGTEAACRVPSDFRGYSLFHALDPRGEPVVYASGYLEQFVGSVEDTFVLEPGSLLGHRLVHGTIREPGVWRISWEFFGPHSAEFPDMWHGQARSDTLELTIVEASASRAEPNKPLQPTAP